ncbi:hypothetical protein [Leptospira adleri]|uniref:Glycosyltransferase RgtA/B/C/D-like domain-containing protein n=1 Tax=Leptospira adleri TaxID=2023186 RepID=A0A2M9YKW3_9LEPT|nr:hypothetical protein [Leptospira adleri]PJZ52171.1 hypothetical protein CH380_15995 [Leptospira adleri]PJZ63243.1 hypothetical protein CH376_04245 [Leptospira adleri]
MRKYVWILLLVLPGLYYVGTLLSWEKKKKLPITGDEPHYLIIAESILRDRDVNLKNNYEEDSITKKILGPTDVENHTIPKNGNLYSVHPIGTSWLVLFGYSLSGIGGARILLALLTGLLPFAFYRIGRMFHLARGESAWLSLLYSISLPFPMAAGQIFPDLPSGIIFVFIFTILLHLETNQRKTEFQNILLFACGIGFGILAWLHVKNMPAMIPLWLWFLFKKEWELKSKLLSLGIGTLLILNLFYWNELWYDSIRGSFFAAKNAPPRLDSRIEHWITVGFGLFMDRNQGLFFQNPLIWIPGCIGWFYLFQNSNLRKFTMLLLITLGIQWALNAGHPCSYGCLALPGRFQWGSAALWFFPFLGGWILLKSLSKTISQIVLILAVSYQIWIGKYWFDHTASLYHVMQPTPEKRAGFFPESILIYLPSWTDLENSWKNPINLLWIVIFLSPILTFTVFQIRNKKYGKNGLKPLIDRENK